MNKRVVPIAILVLLLPLQVYSGVINASADRVSVQSTVDDVVTNSLDGSINVHSNAGNSVQRNVKSARVIDAGECVEPLYIFTGEFAGSQLGRSVSGAGDVNNDGFTDLIAGSPYCCTSDGGTGRAYVYSGANGGLLYTFTGEAAGDCFGSDVSGVIDVHSRMLVGWSMGSRITAELTLEALQQAIDRRNITPELGSVPCVMHHSDRGSQYAATEYQRLLSRTQMICSMSRKGNCWDNAPMESFFAILKAELVYREKFKTRQEAKTKIFEYIEVFYNRQRRHSTLGNISPVDFEQRKTLSS